MTSPLDSYKASLDGLAFDERAKTRMAAKLESAASRVEVEAAAEGRAEAATGAQAGGAGQAGAPARFVGLPERATARRPRRWLGAAAACLATALVVAGGGAAVAAGVLPNPASVLSDVFGEAPAQTELLDNVGRPVGASATSNGVTVTADAVIGDRFNYTIVYSIEFEDASVLDGLAPNENGLLPLASDASTCIDGTMSGGGSSYFYDADPKDNAIQLVETMGIETRDGSSIVGRTAHFSMGDIHALPDAGEAVAVASGSWSLKFEMNYADTTIDLPAGQSTAWQGSGVTIDAVSVSAIGIAVDYTIDRQMGSFGPSGKMDNEGLAEENAVIGLPIVVTFADGTTFDATNANSAATKQGDGTSAVAKTATYDRIASVGDIASVTIGDVAIPVNAA